MSTFGKIFCAVVTIVVLWVIGQIMDWVIDTQGLLAGLGMGVIILAACYVPWLLVAAVRRRRQNS